MIRVQQYLVIAPVSVSEFFNIFFNNLSSFPRKIKLSTSRLFQTRLQCGKRVRLFFFAVSNCKTIRIHFRLDYPRFCKALVVFMAPAKKFNELTVNFPTGKPSKTTVSEFLKQSYTVLSKTIIIFFFLELLFSGVSFNFKFARFANFTGKNEWGEYILIVVNVRAFQNTA